MAPKGITAELVRNHKAGVVVDPENVTAIKDALKKLYDQSQTQPPKAYIPDPFPQYSRIKLTGELARIFNTMKK